MIRGDSRNRGVSCVRETERALPICRNEWAARGAPVDPRSRLRRNASRSSDRYRQVRCLQSAPRSQTRSADRVPASGGPRGVWTDLEGAVNDVEAMRVVLVTRFGFKREDVHTLQNGEATRAAILRSVKRWLIDSAVEGDVSFFYYAGHGSQVRNSRSREPDKMDESLVPADSNAGQPDIRDKELTALLNQALDKHVLLTVVLDSCHSGSMSRGQIGSIRSEACPPMLAMLPIRATHRLSNRAGRS